MLHLCWLLADEYFLFACQSSRRGSPRAGPPRGHPQPASSSPIFLPSLQPKKRHTECMDTRQRQEETIVTALHLLCFTSLSRHSSSPLNFLLHLSAPMKKCRRKAQATTFTSCSVITCKACIFSQDKLWLSLINSKKDAYIYSGIYCAFTCLRN